ncbi:MAG: hypothetical protein JWQ78_485, partial [Sediminibacterium sp.]|nr:hypothetical protein [Sediminibacterium sp.]
PNGYYIDTLSCTAGDIRKLRITVENCNGLLIVNDPQVAPGTAVVESNFTICVPPVTTANCKAAFSYTSTATGIKFNSAGSQAPDGDSIASRSWIFGDTSDATIATTIDPIHAYKKPGSYTVCLYIKTKKGCESKYCATVVFTPESNECKLELKVSTEKLSPKKFRFSSNLSSTLSGDSIVQRTWKFGDGTSLDGNQVSPTKEYRDTGVYNVCLLARTSKGCDKSYCFTVIVKDSLSSTPNCKAYFTYTVKDSTVTFNSQASYGTSADDSIISRTWYYADSTSVGTVTLTGNVINPSYHYSKPGKYPVYLVINTKKGCESKYTATVIVTGPGNCYVDVHVNTEKSNAASRKVRFTSNTTTVLPGDSIIQRRWVFGDNTVLEGNEIYPTKEYKDTGTYYVCLKVKTARGCENSHCFTVVIRDTVANTPGTCKASFTYTAATQLAGTAPGMKFNSSASSAVAGDSIISRSWSFGDSTEILTGNRVDPSHNFVKAGTYNVCLTIQTKKGCESKVCATVIVKPTAQSCKAYFTFTIKDSTIHFNSEGSVASSPDDSITSRTWYYMDSVQSISLAGNVINPSYTYAKPGTYTVYLLIRTKNGCESKYAGTVVITRPAPVNCTGTEVVFHAERTGLKKIQFNSSASHAIAGDSIIQRRWKFGDGTGLEGNVVSPLKEFPIQGVYNTCLQVKTARGCETQVCKQVVAQDSLGLPETTVDYIRIVSINPNPVAARMMVTIWSRNNNVEAEIAIYDIYGTGKMTIKKVLAQGNNIIEITASALYHGPYFLKISSRNGKDTKAFYKL